MLRAHCVYAGSSPNNELAIIERPDTPPEAIALGTRNKLKAKAVINEPIIIMNVSKVCRIGPCRGI
ncbi:hypothetical protein D3C78_1478390 [compost metagenome]